MGYMHHQRSEIDRRSVRVCLTQQGRDIRDIVADLFSRHAGGIQSKGVLGSEGIEDIGTALRRVERYWTDQIRCIYWYSSRAQADYNDALRQIFTVHLFGLSCLISREATGLPAACIGHAQPGFCRVQCGPVLQ